MPDFADSGGQPEIDRQRQSQTNEIVGLHPTGVTGAYPHISGGMQADGSKRAGIEQTRMLPNSKPKLRKKNCMPVSACLLARAALRLNPWVAGFK